MRLILNKLRTFRSTYMKKMTVERHNKTNKLCWSCECKIEIFFSRNSKFEVKSTLNNFLKCVFCISNSITVYALEFPLF
jgi:hypothetical protein